MRPGRLVTSSAFHGSSDMSLSCIGRSCSCCLRPPTDRGAAMDGIVRRFRNGCVAGFTLVELMIALVIGSVVVVSALALYSHGRSAYRVNERVARLQEQGRYALSVIEPDIELAGYYGFT